MFPYVNPGGISVRGPVFYEHINLLCSVPRSVSSAGVAICNAACQSYVQRMPTVKNAGNYQITVFNFIVQFYYKSDIV